MTMGQYKSHNCKALLTMLVDPFFTFSILAYWRKTLLEFESIKILVEHALYVARIQFRTQA